MNIYLHIYSERFEECIDCTAIRFLYINIYVDTSHFQINKVETDFLGKKLSGSKLQIVFI